jgi:hypothetical protein
MRKKREEVSFQRDPYGKSKEFVKKYSTENKDQFVKFLISVNKNGFISKKEQGNDSNNRHLTIDYSIQSLFWRSFIEFQNSSDENGSATPATVKSILRESLIKVNNELQPNAEFKHHYQNFVMRHTTNKVTNEFVGPMGGVLKKSKRVMKHGTVGTFDGIIHELTHGLKTTTKFNFAKMFCLSSEEKNEVVSIMNVRRVLDGIKRSMYNNSRAVWDIMEQNDGNKYIALRGSDKYQKIDDDMYFHKKYIDEDQYNEDVSKMLLVELLSVMYQDLEFISNKKDFLVIAKQGSEKMNIINAGKLAFTEDSVIILFNLLKDQSITENRDETLSLKFEKDVDEKKQKELIFLHYQKNRDILFKCVLTLFELNRTQIEIGDDFQKRFTKGPGVDGDRESKNEEFQNRVNQLNAGVSNFFEDNIDF